MPTLSDATLSCLEVAGAQQSICLEISYSVLFSPLERFLAANGLVFEERITIWGEDPGASADVALHVLPPTQIDIQHGEGPLRVPRSRTLVVSRSSLREDRGFGNDELDARIELVAVGLPQPLVSVVTPEISLTAASAWAR
jgi:hypothetical protein